MLGALDAHAEQMKHRIIGKCEICASTFKSIRRILVEFSHSNTGNSTNYTRSNSVRIQDSIRQDVSHGKLHEVRFPHIGAKQQPFWICIVIDAGALSRKSYRKPNSRHIHRHGNH